MPKATVTGSPASRVSQKIITTEEKPPVAVPIEPEDEPRFKPATKDFWEYIRLLEPADWKFHSCRVYRYPLTEKKPRELGRYLARYDHDNPLFDEKQLTATYGGGQYDLLLSRKNSMLMKHSFEVEGPSKNPDATGLNDGAGRLSGELAQTLSVILQNLQAMRDSGTKDRKLDETIELIGKLSGAMPKPQGATELVHALAELQELTGGSDRTRDTLELLRDLGVIGEKKEAKPLVEQLKDIVEVSNMLRGEGGGGKRDWPTALIEVAPTLLDKAGGLLGRAQEITRNQARVAELRAGIVQPAAPAAATSAAVTPPAAPAAAEPAQAPATPAPEPQAAPAAAIVGPTFDWIKAKIAHLFMDGKEGDAVAEWLDTLDRDLGNRFGALTREQLEKFIESDPILREISTAPRYRDFISEFMEFFTASPAATS